MRTRQFLDKACDNFNGAALTEGKCTHDIDCSSNLHFSLKRQVWLYFFRIFSFQDVVLY